MDEEIICTICGAVRKNITKAERKFLEMELEVHCENCEPNWAEEILGKEEDDEEDEW